MSSLKNLCLCLCAYRLQDKNLDLSFLHSIREVTGYVLISHVDMKKIVLPNLQIIRGRQLFKLNVLDQQFALIVTLSKMENLELPSLRDILQGSAGFYNNYNLCHIRTINWEEIITGFNSSSFYFYNFTQPERECKFICGSSVCVLYIYSSRMLSLQKFVDYHKQSVIALNCVCVCEK